ADTVRLGESSLFDTLSEQKNRAHIIVGIVIVFSMIQTSWMLSVVASVDTSRVGKDLYSQHDRRFSGIKQDLPRHGVVGYLTDHNDTGRFMFTQYGLAPLVVDTTLQHQYVVGNFKHGTPEPTMFSELNVSPIQDYENGIILIAGDVP
ncbi:MAG: hypothetical protein QGG50_06555, partial [Methanopyri archaeon]|nr:hypothetical protein [Methanopyri archaeon]